MNIFNKKRVIELEELKDKFELLTYDYASLDDEHRQLLYRYEENIKNTNSIKKRFKEVIEKGGPTLTKVEILQLIDNL